MTNPGPPTVAPLDPQDLPAVVAIHRASFPDYRSTQLGAPFCARLLGAFDAHADALVAVGRTSDGKVAGYLVGAPPEVQRAVNDRLVPWAVRYAVPAALRSPRQARGALGAVVVRARRATGALARRRPRAAPSGSDAPPAASEASAGTPPADVRVVLVAVDEAARGSGTVDALLAEFARWARGRGHRRADLSVVASNAAAARAYERAGWVPGAPEADGTVVRYWLELDGRP